MSTTSIKVVFRPSARGDHSPGSLSLRLIYKRDCSTVTISSCSIYPEEWNRAKQEIVYPTNNPRRTAYLKRVEKHVNEELELLTHFVETRKGEGRFTVGDVITQYKLRKDENNLLGYAELLSKEKEAMGNIRTARAYRTVTRALVRFNHGEDIPLGQINERLIVDFENHLKDQGKKPNTISYYNRNLRSIYNKAAKENRICRKENIFEHVYTKVMKTVKRALTVDEMKKVHETDFSELFGKEVADTKERKELEEAERAALYFRFSFYCYGMCFVDLALLKKENIQGDIISYVRKKTGQPVEIRISDKMRTLIGLFARETENSPYLFPVIRDKDRDIRLQYESALKKQNLLLKRVAALAGIDKPLTTHMARHTWATIAKRKNIPLRVISECLGHTSERTTRIYMDSLELEELGRANELVASAIDEEPLRRPFVSGEWRMESGDSFCSSGHPYP